MRTEEELREHCAREDEETVIRCDICGDEIYEDYWTIDGKNWCGSCYDLWWKPEHYITY